MFKILILSYRFNQSEHIGAKRWFNLSKYLSKYAEVDIITSSNVSKPSWVNNLFYLKSNYPEILNKIPENLYEKFLYKIFLLKQLIFFRGSPYDKGKNNLKSLQNLIFSICKKKSYNVIISSGAPFSWLLVAPFLKKNNFIFNSTKIVSDIRDPWTWSSNYGMDIISEKRKIYEIEKERYVVENSDLVFIPQISMFTHLNNSYKTNNFVHLPHGYDESKINSVIKNNTKIKSQKIKFIYGGNWYEGNNKIIANLIKRFKENNLSIDIEIYTTFQNKNIPKSYSENQIDLAFKNFISEESLFHKIFNSNFYLLIMPPLFSSFLSAKFFEICSLRIPIIYIGEKGAISDFIKKHNIGFHLSLENFNDNFLVHEYSTINNEVLNQYSFENLSTFILEKLHSN
mgnify:CR=1 FL=1|tara:strand:+ start:138 stop:1334 length:1197 start_codon:yes stop_codon:yes gene_type:complete